MVCVPAPLPPRRAPASDGGSEGAQAGASVDLFGFAGGDARLAATQGWLTLATWPWSLAWAVQAELVTETWRFMGLAAASGRPKAR